MPNEVDQFQGDFLFVNVLVKIKNIDFNGTVMVLLQGRAGAHVQHTAVLLGIDPYFYRINTIWGNKFEPLV